MGFEQLQALLLGYEVVPKLVPLAFAFDTFVQVRAEQQPQPDKIHIMANRLAHEALGQRAVPHSRGLTRASRVCAGAGEGP